MCLFLSRSARKGKTYYDEDLGEKVYIPGTTNNKFSFQKLYDNGYLPITCHVSTGDDIIARQFAFRK